MILAVREVKKLLAGVSGKQEAALTLLLILLFVLQAQ